jgi:hypothetical protein
MKNSPIHRIAAGLVAIIALLILAAPTVQAQADWLQVWARRSDTDDFAWIIEYRDAAGTVLAAYDIPPDPRLYPKHHSAGRLIDGASGVIVVFDPYRADQNFAHIPSGVMEVKGTLTGTAIHPNGQDYAYSITQMSEGEDPWHSWIFVATLGTMDDRLVLQEDHPRSLWFELLAWSPDGNTLLFHAWESSLSNQLYTPFFPYNEARLLDVNTGDTQSVGTIIGFADDLEYFAMTAEREPTGIMVLERSTDTLTEYPLPDLGEQPAIVGSAFFSPDRTQVAYQAARWKASDEIIWTIVVDLASGDARVIFKEEPDTLLEQRADLHYGEIGGWLDNTTLAVGSIWSGHTAVVDVTNGTLLREETGAFLGYAVGMADTTGFTPSGLTAPVSCDNAPLSRLQIDQRGRITFTDGTPTNVRDAPGLSGEKIATVPEGAAFTVLDGPVCADDYAWWKLAFDDGVTGFVAEGTPEEYFLEPWP